MAFKIDRRNGQNYAENYVDPLLDFNDGTWSISSGTGTATLDSNNFVSSGSSLKIENNVPLSAITATNSTQNTLAPINGEYQISWYIKKNLDLEVVNGSVLIYKNAILFDTQSYSIGSDIADLPLNEFDVWVRYQSDVNYIFDKDDVITFQFRIDSSETIKLTTYLYIDGVMLNLASRNNTIVPLYTSPSTNVSADDIQVMYNTLGWGLYADDEVAGQTITTTPSKLIINGLGATSNSDYLPHEIRGFSELWDVATSKMTPIVLGDGYSVRLDLGVLSETGNPTELKVNFDIGGGATPTNVIVENFFVTGKSVPYSISTTNNLFSLSTFLANGGQMFLSVDVGSLSLGKKQVQIHRISNGKL